MIFTLYFFSLINQSINCQICKASLKQSLEVLVMSSQDGKALSQDLSLVQDLQCLISEVELQ